MRYQLSYEGGFKKINRFSFFGLSPESDLSKSAHYKASGLDL